MEEKLLQLLNMLTGTKLQQVLMKAIRFVIYGFDGADFKNCLTQEVCR